MPIISNIMYKWALLIVTVMSVNTDRVTALSPAPSPEADCTTLVYNMSDCLTYVEKGSNVSKPDKACCPELGEMLDTKPVCLCQLLGKSKDFPVELDVNRALDLPHVCGFSTPSASLCSEVFGSIGSFRDLELGVFLGFWINLIKSVIRVGSVVPVYSSAYPVK
ncbi:hypothetical protein RND81_04G155700 [Saponaria officinalis]|uniref:Bifunctional inhibitor/plant lipid transfer protein/seed storage helical domain-containing protein n=1 Tax=Saponaria officinalis TaxID=3572 RepID=A0AAW1LL29_SAPOF